MGPLYPREQDAEVKENQRVANSTAPNVFQWNLLAGLDHELPDQFNVINVLPVGTWPRGYRKMILRSRNWVSGRIPGHEIGCVNLPFIKQYLRYQKARRILKAQTEQGTEIIIYSAYMPFLKAVYRMDPTVKVTVIITDLPEFYDLGQVSFLRRRLREMQNRMIYRYMERVDRFVVLTDQMTEPLRIGDRPWMRMEGICDARIPAADQSVSDTKAIFYSGTLHYQYGIRNLLNAFRMMDDPSLALWICGSGEAEKEIVELSKQDPRVRFWGFCTQQEVAELRSKAAVLVNPRTNEGVYTKYSFPSKTMEYMASGKPVVMYKLDGIPDEYDPYLFFAAAGEDAVQGLKNALLAVLEHYDEAMLKAAQARAFVIEDKNSIHQAHRVVTFIRESP